MAYCVWRVPYEFIPICNDCKWYIQNTFIGDLFRFSWVGPSPSCDQAGSIQPDCSCRQHSGHGLPYHWNSTSHNPLEKGWRGVVLGLSLVHHRQWLPGDPLRQGHWHICEWEKAMLWFKVYVLTSSFLSFSKWTQASTLALPPIQTERPLGLHTWKWKVWKQIRFYYWLLTSCVTDRPSHTLAYLNFSSQFGANIAL